MLDLKRLAAVGRAGLAELWPALRAFARAPEADGLLGRVYGPAPLARLVLVGVLAALAGQLFERLGPDLPGKAYVHWGALALSLALAGYLRRYLFRSGQIRAAEFPTLACSIAPATLAMLLVSVLAEVLLGPLPAPQDGFADPRGVGAILFGTTELLALAAVVSIAVASLCYSRDWPRALLDLAVRLLVFRVLVWITALVLVDIGIVGAILGAVLEELFGIRFPEWMQVLADQLSYSVLLVTAYAYVLGGTWLVCRRTLPELLETGHVDVPRALEALGRPEKAPPQPDP